MTDDSTPEGTVEQESAHDADALLDRFLGVSDKEDAPDEQDDPDNSEVLEADADSTDTDLPPAEDKPKADEDHAEKENVDQPVEAGRFVADDGKVRMADGTVVTVAELKRGSLRESDYTRKTQEIAAHRQELQTRQAELTQQEQTIGFAIEVANASLPPEPDQSMIHTDPIGYLQQKSEYDARLSQLQQLYAAKQQMDTAHDSERKRAFQQWAEGERDRLAEAVPELKDPAKLTVFNSALVKTIERYGFSAQDAANIYDHRFILLAKDLIEYHKILANKPKAMAKTEGKPPLSPARRSSPQSEKNRDRQGDWQKLRQSNGKDAGALDRILDNLI